jgi:hypothetical protein
VLGNGHDAPIPVMALSGAEANLPHPARASALPRTGRPRPFRPDPSRLPVAACLARNKLLVSKHSRFLAASKSALNECHGANATAADRLRAGDNAPIPDIVRGTVRRDVAFPETGLLAINSLR